MEKKRNRTRKQEVVPETRSEMDKKLDPANVAESKRTAWEQQQRSKD